MVVPSVISSTATWQARTQAVHKWTAWAHGGGKVSPTVDSTDSHATMHLRQARMQASYGEGNGDEEEDMSPLMVISRATKWREK